MQVNKVAIGTGGSRGIGRNTVQCLAKQGVHVIFTYNSNREEADAVVALTAKSSAQAVALQLDTGDTKAFDRFVGEVGETLSKLGAERCFFLVNNAGPSSSANLETFPVAALAELNHVH